MPSFSFLLWQLKMYENMGFKVNHSNPIYKRFRLKVLGIFSQLISFSSFGASSIFEVLMNLQMDQFMNDSGLACKCVHISACVLKILVLSLIVHVVFLKKAN